MEVPSKQQMQSIVRPVSVKNKGKSVAVLTDSRLRTCIYSENDSVRIPANMRCRQISRKQKADGGVKTDEVCRIENSLKGC